MEAKTEMTSHDALSQGGGGGPQSFIKHVFNFDDDSKNDMMNIIQYSILAIIPVVALNKSIQRFVPEVDETKGSLEILVEVAAQTIAMFIGILLIHRVIVYVPTYSKVKYNDLNVTGIVLAFLVIVLSLQTKLGEKVNLLLERVIDIVDGNTSLREGMQAEKDKDGQCNGGGQGNGGQSNGGGMQSGGGYIDNNNYSNPPMHGTINPHSTSHTHPATSAADIGYPQSQTTPLQQAEMPGMGGYSEPAAANDGFFGGSPF
tara:strand:- start:180 stop:956 length:777 start_codon:yes stop_codon:yes gene_type:complete